jgi:4'-phosphopantetheinyl transferase
MSDITLEQLSREIHLWVIELIQRDDTLSILKRLLDKKELKRLNQYVLYKDKRRFLISRSILKEIIGKYLDVNAKDISITYNLYGKPCLDESINPEHIDFSLAHSHELVVYAISRQRRVGVDLEYIHRELDHEKIGYRFFTKRENKIIKSLPETHKREAFFNGWTRKEALLKAMGDDEILDFHNIEVSLSPGEVARIIDSNDKNIDASEWQIIPFSPHSDYIGSIVGNNKPWKVNYPMRGRKRVQF